MYTKGKWKAMVNPILAITIGEGDELVVIADIFGGVPEAKANAYLIAAAPDMYEALKELIGALEDTGCDEIIPEETEIAKQALAKADS